MAPRRTFDYALPYDLMVGYWAGIATVYDAKGEEVILLRPDRANEAYALDVLAGPKVVGWTWA